MAAPLELVSALSGSYRLERELGAGGMATVFLAEDLKHKRKVAVKVLRPELAATLGPERFLREVTIAANLQHPHVLPLYDSGQAAGFLYYVMPFVEGTSLRQKLVREGELPVTDAVRILRDVADAMAYAHQRGVVHRDIKPENVMLSGRHALVTDFGVAKAVSEATGRQSLTTAGVALGTPTYMAPEQAAADPHTDHRADIYAFGVMAYELLTGQPPFSGPSPQAVLAAHITVPAEPVTKYRSSIPPALAALVMRCLEKKPADRLQSAEDLMPQLEAVLTPSGGMTPAATQPMTAVRAPLRRSWLVAAAVLALVAVAAGFLWRRRGSATPVVERFAVVPFENRTGMPEHDELGALIADWATRGLVDARLAEVVPTTVVAAAIARLGGTPGEAMPIGVARETGATRVVSGSYYAAGDSIRFQAEVIDARSGKPTSTLPPTTVLPAAVMAAMDTIGRRVVGGLAVAGDSYWATYAAPPSLEVYRLFVRAWESFWRDPGEGERLHRQALALDSTYAPVILGLAVNLLNQQRRSESDSVLRSLEQRNPRLAPGEQNDAQWTRAALDGDTDGMYRVNARNSERLGDGAGRQQIGYEAMMLNRPREALREFARIKPRSLEMSGIPHHYKLEAESYHMLGEDDAALEAIRKGRAQFPRSFWLARVEAVVLAALGREEELHRLEEEARNLPRDPWGGVFGELLIDVAEEQAAHGDSAGAATTAEQAVAWFASRAQAEREALMEAEVKALYMAGRRDEAAALLPSSCPPTRDDPWCLGWKSILAIERGDTAAARSFKTEIAAMEFHPRSLQSNQALWLSMIDVAEGNFDGGMEQLRDSFAKGTTYGDWLHRSVLLAPLRSSPAFKEFLRPKG